MRSGDGDDNAGKEKDGPGKLGKAPGWSRGEATTTDPESGAAKRKCCPAFWQRAKRRAKAGEFILSVENNLTHFYALPCLA